MKKFNILPSLFALLALLSLVSLSSCLKDDDPDTSEWRKLNDTYMETMAGMKENGVNVFTKVVPDWAPGTYVLMQWHNDPALTQNNLSPMDNSKVNCKYELETIDGSFTQNSYSLKTNGDSIYQTRPMSNITGFWTALTRMHVGDSCTVIIPYTAGYGNINYGNIKAYSTLIYRIKLKSIVAYESPE